MISSEVRRQTTIEIKFSEWDVYIWIKGWNVRDQFRLLFAYRLPPRLIRKFIVQEFFLKNFYSRVEDRSPGAIDYPVELCFIVVFVQMLNTLKSHHI